mmetsp:Transcript_10553/g.28878  ORF Transcript_10553/g.28878 Transcript_10553/m.28878 type:complete len:312 (-) Transcript_10553:640-1575(-)
MPMPVSRTNTSTSSFPLRVAPIQIWPLCVNLQALPMRLWKIWMMRPMSPSTYGMLPGTCTTSLTPRLVRGPVSSTTSSTILYKLTFSCFTASLPLRMDAASRMSLTRFSRREPLVLMVEMVLSTLSFTSPQLPMMSASDRPMIPFRGVRSSWLMLLMKRSFCSTSSFSSWMTLILLPSSTMRMVMRRRCSMVRKLPCSKEELNMTLPMKSKHVHIHSSVTSGIGRMCATNQMVGKENHRPTVKARKIFRLSFPASFWDSCREALNMPHSVFISCWKKKTHIVMATPDSSRSCMSVPAIPVRIIRTSHPRAM